MEQIIAELSNAKKIAIAGHIRPDGDCVGSCMALFEYLKLQMNEIGIEQIDVYLEPFSKSFDLLKGVEEVHHSYESEEIYDVFISVDCGSLDRLGNAIKYFNSATKTINVDHHISNTLFANVNHVVSNASSTCEVLYGIFVEEMITKEIAEALYTGIIHDTGVFKHSNTSEKTMNIAGKLIGKGIAFSKLIDESFYQKTYVQNQILGRCLMESMLVLDGKCIVSSVNKKIMDFYNTSSTDFDGIIDQLRIIEGVEVAIFIFETDFHEYKVSMRSNGEVNVSQICVYFGGGGHIKAAGCTMRGSMHDVLNNLTLHIEHQLLKG